MFKRILLLLFAMVVVLAAIVVTRAAMFSSKQATVTPVVKLDINLDAAVQRLSKAVTFKTVSYEDPTQSDASQFDGMHAFMAEAYPRTHAALQIEKVGTQSLLYTWAGSDVSLKPILLMAHQDVVPVVPGTEKDWEQDAFSGVVKDGFIWGRGTMDDKFSLLSEFSRRSSSCLRRANNPNALSCSSLGRTKKSAGCTARRRVRNSWPRAGFRSSSCSTKAGRSSRKRYPASPGQWP